MRRSKYTRPAWLREQGEGGQGTADQPRLTTSAMIASLAGADQRTKPAPFGHALAALAATRPEIVGLTADLGKYTDLHIFAQAHPERFYQMGMAEQLLISAAAGMAREGFMPFATLQLPTSFPVASMACWLPSRACPFVLSRLKALHFE